MERRAVIRWLGAAALTVAAGDLTVVARRRGEPATGASGQPASARPDQGERGDAAAPRTPPRHGRVEQRSASAAEAVGRLEVLCRGAWGARPPTGPYRRHVVDRLTVHHTAVVPTDDREAPARVRRHQARHQERGFVDLAYHFVVDRRGRIYAGRPVTAVGETFTDYDPAGHFLPCLEGNFDRQLPAGAQLDALVGLLAWAARTFGVSPATIRGHRDYAATRCPGDALQRLVDDGTLRRRVEAVLAAGGVRLVAVCGAAGRRWVAAIETGAV